ncbi:hypothetical protein KUCAC02_023551, partial [Chaenocephalus aceratus]
ISGKRRCSRFGTLSTSSKCACARPRSSALFSTDESVIDRIRRSSRKVDRFLQILSQVAS